MSRPVRRLATLQCSLAALEPWKAHDYANLIVLPPVIALTAAALATPVGFARALAFYMMAYIALDSAWLAVQPDIVKAPHTLLAHHAVTTLLLLHPLTHAPHLKYVAMMTIVEVNTFLLILRRHTGHGVRLVELLFALSWIAIRVLWFPCLAVYLTLFERDWGGGLSGMLRHTLVSSCTLALSALQWRWTADVLRKTATWQRWRGRTPGEQQEGKSGFL